MASIGLNREKLVEAYEEVGIAADKLACDRKALRRVIAGYCERTGTAVRYVSEPAMEVDPTVPVVTGVRIHEDEIAAWLLGERKASRLPRVGR